MMELVFVACLLAAPDECREWTIVVGPQPSHAACVGRAPRHLVRWQVTHPGWRVSRWTCRDEGSGAQPV